MEAEVTAIESRRLTLISMTPAFLEACLAGDLVAAAHLLGLSVPPEWLQERPLMKIRLDQLRRDPTLQPWLLRAIGLRQERVMIGHIGFHSRPGADYLRNFAPGGVEFGYTVFAPFQRRGYATKAAEALMAWASREGHVTRFVVSISPDNRPSLAVARRLGFHKVGAHVDDEDGREDIFVCDI
jgi:RimJ/RimL family protein N-acetyltransferase